MSAVNPSPAKLEALRQRWTGEQKRLARIAESMLRGEDWTEHLRGLPMIHEIPPLPGEACGRDLRGADLRRFLHPVVDIHWASEAEAALVAAITLEAMKSNTPLAGTSPFPADSEGADGMAIAMRRGERFLVARCAGKPVGVVRLAERVEFQELTAQRSYLEVSGLAVLPDHRRGGIGAELLEASEQIAADEGFGHALLRTTYEVGLVPYYELRGYDVRHVRQLSYPDSPTFLDVVMTKPVELKTPSGTGRPPVAWAPTDARR